MSEPLRRVLVSVEFEVFADDAATLAAAVRKAAIDCAERFRGAHISMRRGTTDVEPSGEHPGGPRRHS
jgi:hypothetical protein